MNPQQSICKISKGQFSDRGSKFYSFLHPLNNLDTYKNFIRRYKQKNPNACHVCSAYRIYLNGWTDEYATDDGEPNGSAGLPILNSLKRNNIVNAAIYVVRIYGGTNLGIPGLIHAYNTSASNAIKNASLFNWKPVDHICIQYNYDLDKTIISIIKSVDGKIINQEFKEEIISYIEINEGFKDDFISLLNEKTSGRVSVLK